MKLFEKAGIEDFSKEKQKINSEKLLLLAIYLEKSDKENSERAFKLAQIFSNANSIREG